MLWKSKANVQSAELPLIVRFAYLKSDRLLSVEMDNGAKVVHSNVMMGIAVGLDVALDKRAFYDSEIITRYPGSTLNQEAAEH